MKRLALRLIAVILAAVFVIEFGIWVKLQRYEYHSDAARTDRWNGTLEVRDVEGWVPYK